ncbi:MAG: hypothetical protein P4L16_01540 [Chlamydiales bacterium]|nr:hypothetical protein [Chlamydiales bacterium]
MEISRYLVEFQQGKKDYCESIADLLLWTSRSAFGGYNVRIIESKANWNENVIEKRVHILNKVALGLIAIISSVFTLIGLACAYTSTSHEHKFRELILAKENKPKHDKEEPKPVVNPAAEAEPVSVINPAVEVDPVPVDVVNVGALIDSVEELSGLSDGDEGDDNEIFDGSLPRVEERGSSVLVVSPPQVEEPRVADRLPVDPNGAESAVFHEEGTFLDKAAGGVFKVADRVFSAIGNVVTTGVNLFGNVFAGRTHPWLQQLHSFPLIAVQKKDKEGSFPACQTLLDRSVIDLLEPLKRLELVDPNTMQAIHKSFLTSLRDILNSQVFKDELEKKKSGASYDLALDHVLELCYVRFRNTHMHSFYFELMREVIMDGRSELHKNSPVRFGVPNAYNVWHDLTLKQQFEAIDEAILGGYGVSRAAVGIGKAEGAIGMLFDPHAEDNIPSHWYTIEEGFINCEHAIHCLRFGTPTIDGLRSTEVNPEFRGYLESLRAKNEKHLYVSLQQYGKNNADGKRNQCIIDLQKEFPDFAVVVLAQDSKFYKQEDKWSQENLASQSFINDFKEQLMDSTGASGFYFPEDWRASAENRVRFETMLGGTLERVHKVMFNDKIELSREERKDFIETFYAFLTLELLKTSQPHSFNMSCKDAIDRAGKCNALLYALLSSLSEDRDTVKKERTAMIHGPAWMVKKQAMVGDRRERLLSAIARLDEQREEIQWELDGEYVDPGINLSTKIWKNPNLTIHSDKKDVRRGLSVPAA